MDIFDDIGVSKLSAKVFFFFKRTSPLTKLTLLFVTLEGYSFLFYLVFAVLIHNCVFTRRNVFPAEINSQTTKYSVRNEPGGL